MQDNGTQLRIGEGVWRSAVRNGDAGGVAFDPGAPGRFVAQTIQSTWTEDGGQSVTPTFRLASNVGSAFRVEEGQAAFYSYAAVTPHRRRDSGHAAGSGHRPRVVQRAVGPRPLGRRRVATPVGDTADDHRPASRGRLTAGCAERALAGSAPAGPSAVDGNRGAAWHPRPALAEPHGAPGRHRGRSALPHGPRRSRCMGSGSGRHPPAGPGRGPAGRDPGPRRGARPARLRELQRSRSRPDSARGVLSRHRPPAGAVVVVGRRALPSDHARDAAQRDPFARL